MQVPVYNRNPWTDDSSSVRSQDLSMIPQPRLRGHGYPGTLSLAEAQDQTSRKSSWPVNPQYMWTWFSFCSHPLPNDVKQMADVQLSVLRQLFHLKKSVTPAIIFRELAEKPWVHRWWNQVLGFMHRLSLMPQSGMLC